MGTEIQDVQQELALVKKAMRDNGAYLGMSGETLQRYFLQLNEKENLFLSTRLASSAQGVDLLSGGSPMTNGGMAGGYGGPASPAAPLAPARELPSGTPEAMDKDSLPSVTNHMNVYEGSAVEAAKSLRALSALAYNNAAQVGEDPQVLPQILRLLALHSTQENVQINGMRALCNMAYDSNVALNRLSNHPVFAAIVGAMVRMPNSKEIGSKASEAVARVVAAEVGPDRVPHTVPPEKGPLTALFTVVQPDDPAGRDVVIQLIQQLVSNEVSTADELAARLIKLAELCQRTDRGATAWLMLAKQVAMKEISTISEHLITRGAIAAAAEVMVAQKSYAPAQLSGIEAMSGLVGSRWIGLQAFATQKGIERIEDAMRAHPNEAVLQTKGIRALASGIQWPEDIQTKARYNYVNGVTLTKAAMAKHGDCEDLIVAGMEALAKYLDKLKCVKEVEMEDGAGLVKAVMMRHSTDKVKDLGSKILAHLGQKASAP